MANTSQRSNRAFRIAYWPDVQRITYTWTLTTFIHIWAHQVLMVLIPSALTMLQFLSALNRSGRQGYIGCAVAYELLAQQIRKATGRSCSSRTIERAVSALKKLGLIETRRHTIRDHHGKQSQINLISLTDRSLALWDVSKRADGARYLRLILPSPTPAKLAERSQKEQIDKSIMIHHNNDVTTRPPAHAPRATVTVEHSASTDIAPRPVPDGAELEQPTDLEQPNSPAVSGTPVETAKGRPRMEACDLGQQNPTSNRRGCSAERPALQPWAQNKKTRTVSGAFILHVLHRCLEKYSMTDADAIFAQARWEIFQIGAPQSVDWSYYLERFTEFQPNHRILVMFRDILPALKRAAPLPPAEPRRKYKNGEAAKKAPLVPFLQEFADFGKLHPKTDQSIGLGRDAPPSHVGNSLNRFLSGVKNRILGDD